MRTIPLTPVGFFACSSGELIRTTGPATTVRENYRKTHRDITSGADLRATLRAGGFAWPGGYPLFFLTNDGETLSFAGALDRYSQEVRNIRERSYDRIVACDVNWEDDDMRCAHTNEPIPCAYPSDDETQ